MADAPEKIRAIRDQQVLEIEWTPKRVCRYPFKLLRYMCPCASCVNEFTGERILQPEDVPDDVAPEAMEFSGNYALKFHWSDGHHTGLYSWDHLDRLTVAEAVQTIEQP